MTLTCDALPGEVRERGRRRLANPVGQDHEGDGDEPIRSAIGSDRGLGAAEEDHAPSRLGVRARLREVGVVVRRAQQHVGRAEHPRPPGPEVGAAPLAGGRERDGRGGEPPVRGVGEALADREEGGVRVGFGGGERRERVAVHTVLAEQLDLVDDQTALGERARLVDAQDVDAREHLDRRQLLHQHATLGQPDDADRERHARQEHETLRHHRDGGGHRTSERVAHVRVRTELADEEQRRGRDQQPRHDPQDLVDPAPQLRTREAEPPPLLGELRRVRLRADTRGPEPSAPRRDERPREHLVARRLDRGLGLAGQQRFVDLERGGLEHLAVDHDLIARLELEHVVEDDLGERHLADLAVANDPRVRRRQHRQRVERPLRAQLLVDPDAGVRDQHEPEQRVLDRADDQDHHQERAEQRVEPREDVGPDDLPDRARGDGRHVVDLAARDALGDLLRGQALGGGHGARYRTPGVSRSARHHSSS